MEAAYRIYRPVTIVRTSIVMKSPNLTFYSGMIKVSLFILTRWFVN